MSQALNRLEDVLGLRLLNSGPRQGRPDQAGEIFGSRVERALARLDLALATIAPRLVLTATRSQLAALVALCDAENFTLAAGRLGFPQPTVHRTISLLEAEAGRPLFPVLDGGRPRRDRHECWPTRFVWRFTNWNRPVTNWPNYRAARPGASSSGLCRCRAAGLAAGFGAVSRRTPEDAGAGYRRAL
ncbi:MAG: LysR family transcriptional regulator [Paracoccaceae bacterium]